MANPPTQTPPSASATATTNPPQAGLRDREPPLETLGQMLENVVNTLRDTAAVAINPRITGDVASLLSSQSVALQAQSNVMAQRIDELAATGQGGLAVYRELTDLGSRTQSYVQAVVEALNNAGESVHVGRLGQVGRIGETPSSSSFGNNAKTWAIFGVSAIVVIAGFGIFAAHKYGPLSGAPSTGRIKGALPAR